MTVTLDAATKNSYVTLSGGNLVASSTSVNPGGAVSTDSKSTGKWYAEFTLTQAGSINSTFVGIIDDWSTYVTTQVTNNGGSLGGTNSYAYYSNNGWKYYQSTNGAYGASYTSGDVIGVALDVVGRTVEFFKNGASQGQITGITAVGSLAGTGWKIGVASLYTGSGTMSWTANFGDSAFVYSAPTGFSSWSAPAPSVGNGSPSLQQLTAVGYRMAAGAGTMAPMTAAGGFNGIGAVSLQPLNASGSGGSNFAALALLPLTASGVGHQANFGVASLEQFTASATGTQSPYVTVDLTVPAPTLASAAYTGVVITVQAAAPAILLAATGDNQAIIRSALQAPAPLLVATLPRGNVITAALQAASPIMAAAGYPAYIITAALAAPAPYLSAAAISAITAAFRTWVLNLRKGALTEYDNFSFNSYAVFNGQVIAAGSGGLFALGTQATDAGTAITARARTAKESFASSFLKRMPRVYLGHETDGDLVFRTVLTESGTRSYSLQWNHISDIQQRRIPIGKGPKSVYWQFEVENVGGSDFNIKNILAYPQKMHRRVQ